MLGVNNTSGVAVDFTKNWWGSDTGPVVPNNGVSALVTTNPFAVALASTVTASTHEIGETGTLDTNITVNNLYGAQLRVSHDNTVLAFQPFPTSIHNDVGGFFWDIVSENFVSVSSPTGVRLSGSMGAGAPYNHPTPANLSGQSIATWKYNCTSAGTSTLMYDNTAGFGTLLANKSGGNLSAALIGDSISCTAATASSVDGFIKLQGRIGGAASPAGWNSAVVTLTCTGGACIGSGPYNFPATDINGHYQIIKVGPGTGVALGTYSASVVRRAYLGATKGTPVTVSGPTTIDLVGSAPTLLGGDVTGDNAVGIGDLTAIGGSFGNTVTADTGSDINGDGFVNIFDLVLAGGNYGTSTSLWP